MRLNLVVSTELHMRLTVSEESSLPVIMRLRYESADPYAVHAVFPSSGYETVEWVFARGLLTEGLKRSVGLGDVRVWPIWSHAPYEIGIALISESGTAVLTTQQQELKSFLKWTEAAVPPGCEHFHLDLETQLARILANG